MNELDDETVEAIAIAACDAHGGVWADSNNKDGWQRWVRCYAPAFRAYLPDPRPTEVKAAATLRESSGRVTDDIAALRALGCFRPEPDYAEEPVAVWLSDKSYEIYDEPSRLVLPPEAVSHIEIMSNHRVARYGDGFSDALDALVAMLPEPETVTIRHYEVRMYRGYRTKITYERHLLSSDPVPVGWEVVTP